MKSKNVSVSNTTMDTREKKKKRREEKSENGKFLYLFFFGGSGGDQKGAVNLALLCVIHWNNSYNSLPQNGSGTKFFVESGDVSMLGEYS